MAAQKNPSPVRDGRGVQGFFIMCGQRRIRTADTRLFRPLLYLLSYLTEYLPDSKTALEGAFSSAGPLSTYTTGKGSHRIAKPDGVHEDSAVFAHDRPTSRFGSVQRILDRHHILDLPRT